MLIFLDLPYPPSVNAYWLTSGRRKYLSKRGVLFKQQVAEYVIEKKIPKLGSIRLQMDIILRPRSKKLMDIDNCAKAILDSLQDAGVFDDDSQVWKLNIERGISKKGGGCIVMIMEYSDEPPIIELENLEDLNGNEKEKGSTTRVSPTKKSASKRS